MRSRTPPGIGIGDGDGDGDMGFPISIVAVKSGVREEGVADDAVLVDNATIKQGRRVMRGAKNMASKFLRGKL